MSPMRVSEMPHEDRAATRPAELGPSPLSVVELLSIIVGGDKGLACAQQLITKSHGATGSIRDLGRLSIKELCSVPGIGQGTALRIQAAMEFGKRLQLAARPESKKIQSPRDAVQYYAPLLEDLLVEEMHVAVLNAMHCLTQDILITKGLINSSLVAPREIFREAIKYQAAAIILVHNHPSGDPTPSQPDREVTEQLVAAGRLMDIPVHDHIIIGRGRYTSFAEAGLL